MQLPRDYRKLGWKEARQEAFVIEDNRDYEGGKQVY